MCLSMCGLHISVLSAIFYTIEERHKKSFVKTFQAIISEMFGLCACSTFFLKGGDLSKIDPNLHLLFIQY